MSLLFDVSARMGSFKDTVSGQIFDNTSAVTIGRTRKGREYAFNGSQSLDIPRPFAYSSIFSFVCFTSFYDVANVRFMMGFSGASGQRSDLLQFNNRFGMVVPDGVKLYYETVPSAKAGVPYCIVATWDGVTPKMYVNGTEKALTLFAAGIDSATVNQVRVGDTVFDVTPTAFASKGFIGRAVIYDHVLSSDERDDWKDIFDHTFTISPHPATNKGTFSGNDPQILNITGITWDADQITKTDRVGNFRIDSGSFRCKEDATSKYIECVTNGVIAYTGLDLSSYTGNGYILRLDGDLSSDAGGTVDAASAVSFAGNVVSITMTAGQVLRNLTIIKEAP